MTLPAIAAATWLMAALSMLALSAAQDPSGGYAAEPAGHAATAVCRPSATTGADLASDARSPCGTSTPARPGVAATGMTRLVADLPSPVPRAYRLP